MSRYWLCTDWCFNDGSVGNVLISRNEDGKLSAYIVKEIENGIIYVGEQIEGLSECEYGDFEEDCEEVLEVRVRF